MALSVPAHSSLAKQGLLEGKRSTTHWQHAQALALVRQHHGAQTAVAVAKRLVVVAQRQGGQSQFSPYVNAPSNADSPVASLQTYVMAHIGQRHTLESLANQVNMSPRNLIRHFLQEMGITPHEFVVRARIDAARLVLESGGQPLKTVAYECGFGTADQMRVVFRERLGITPSQYRARFRSSCRVPALS